jgi:preprotein translocase subunit SecF
LTPARIDADQGGRGKKTARISYRRITGELTMLRLTMILFTMISTTLMGVAIVVALVMGLDTLQPIVIAAAIGFVAAIPASWLVALQMR